MAQSRMLNGKYQGSKLTKAMLVGASIVTLSGCFGVDSDNTLAQPDDTNNTTPPVVAPTPDPDQDNEEMTGLSLLSAQGTQWVNQDGQLIKLAGINIGNWLLQEFWMMGQSGEINDQCTLEQTLTERFSYQEKERLMKLFRDNWFQKKDWDLLESFGFNLIRVPFIYSLIEDEQNPMTLRDDAWDYLDAILAEAEKRNMYVILDLHGAVGSQGWEHHSGCSDKNEYWSNESYQERTAWLWQEIATRYKNNGTVAGYGLLNEPWGTSAENLATEIKSLYQAVREIDDKHVVILPGHNSGIDAYGTPSKQGLDNVAFEMHFYPGIFGWGEPGYQVHRDWLTCGEKGDEGVCYWQQKLIDLDTPFLIGEFQPWASMGDLGAPTTRATFDKYGELGWAATAWSYKVLSNEGGQGVGTWGLVTNIGIPFEEKLVGANTWACPGWNSDFANACDVSNVTFTNDVDKTAYLIVKSGGFGDVDITYDNLALIDHNSEQNLLTNGGFGSDNGWTEWLVNGDMVFDYLGDGSALPGGDSTALHITGNNFNGGIYQAIELKAGVTYTLSGSFKDNGSTDSWAEIFLLPEAPVAGVDTQTSQSLPQLNFHTASLEEIEQLFTLFGSIEYDLHQEVMDAMNDPQPAPWYQLPAAPTGLTLVEGDNGVTLNWDANSEADLMGYHVYRSQSPDGEKVLIAELVSETTYQDTQPPEGTNYYVVAAVDNEDISYFSQQVASRTVSHSIPGKIEAEAYSAMLGIQFEQTSDIGGGQNSGHADPDDYLEYQVNVQQAGTYPVTFRLASENGSTGFQLLSDDILIEEIAVPATGGWQSWQDVTVDIALSSGEQTIKLLSVGKEWNLNWFEFGPIN